MIRNLTFLESKFVYIQNIKKKFCFPFSIISTAVCRHLAVAHRCAQIRISHLNLKIKTNLLAITERERMTSTGAFVRIKMPTFYLQSLQLNVK